jgi:hypothetical protein
MTVEKRIRNSTIQFLVFTSQNDSLSVEARYEDDSVWLSQKVMAELFEVDVRTINEHLRNVFDSGELGENSVIRNFRITAADDKNGSYLGEDYFEELLEQIREIRLSERRFYQKVTDIFATSTDYSADSMMSKQFFATVQNKLHFAVHGQTAAELIASRADADAPQMGLTNWANAPEGKILRTDVVVGKNYLSEDELRDLSGLVSAYLELAENRARRRIPMTMADWTKQLDGLLALDDREILTSAGSIAKEVADTAAVTEYERFRVEQDRKFVSDFDRFAAEVEGNSRAKPEST